MNPIRSLFAIGLGLAAFTAVGQYSIDWWKISGGTGTSLGTGYTLSATVGQHDAGQMSSTDFALVGGFWAVEVLQVTNTIVPTLMIVPSAQGQAIVSWAPDVPGFRLQTSDSLSPANWTDVLSGSNHPITISTTESMRFYRLVNP